MRLIVCMCVCVSLFCVFFLIVPHIFLLHIPAISLVEIGNGLRKYHYHNEMRANGACFVFFFFSLLVVWWVSKRGSLATMTTTLMQNPRFFSSLYYNICPNCTRTSTREDLLLPAPEPHASQ